MAEPVRNLKEERHYIWGNRMDDALDAIKEELQEENPDLSEDELYQSAAEIHENYFYDERANLDMVVAPQIIAIADLGFWDGRAVGYKIIPSGNIKDCLEFGRDIDYADWYVDGEGELRSDQSHHDGTHHIRYRAVREDATEEDVEDLLDKVYERRFTEEDIERVTRRLGDDVGKVYGWDFPEPMKPLPKVSGVQEYMAAQQQRSGSRAEQQRNP